MSNPIPRIDPEFKALIPPLSQEEYTQLEHNILAYKKCRDAIVIWNGTIVDGHNRFRICAEHGVPFEIKEMEFESRDEAKLWILDNQLGRRNLSDAARIEMAMRKTELLKLKAKENLRRGGYKKPGEIRAEKPFSKCPKPGYESVNVHNAIVKEAGVSKGTLHNYMQISKHPRLLEKVKNGNMEIGTAHRLLDKEILKQLKHADKLYSFIEEHFPLKGDNEANQEIKSQLIVLQGRLEACQAAYSEVYSQ